MRLQSAPTHQQRCCWCRWSSRRRWRLAVAQCLLVLLAWAESLELLGVAPFLPLWVELLLLLLQLPQRTEMNFLRLTFLNFLALLPLRGSWELLLLALMSLVSFLGLLSLVNSLTLLSLVDSLTLLSLVDSLSLLSFLGLLSLVDSWALLSLVDSQRLLPLVDSWVLMPLVDSQRLLPLVGSWALLPLVDFQTLHSLVGSLALQPLVDFLAWLISANFQAQVVHDWCRCEKAFETMLSLTQLC